MGTHPSRAARCVYLGVKYDRILLNKCSALLSLIVTSQLIDHTIDTQLISNNGSTIVTMPTQVLSRALRNIYI